MMPPDNGQRPATGNVRDLRRPAIYYDRNASGHERAANGPPPGSPSPPRWSQR